MAGAAALILILVSASLGMFQPDEGFPHTFISHAPLEQLSQPAFCLTLAWRAARAISAWQPDQVLIFAYTPVFISVSTLLAEDAMGNRCCCGPMAPIARFRAVG